MKKSVILYICLFVIIMLAFIIRYRGINFGFPLITHPDEPKIVNSAIGMLQRHDLNPHTFLYPSFYIYMQALVYIITFLIGKLIGIFQDFSGIEITILYFWGRMLTITFSIGTICLTYLIGRLLFDKVTGIIATLFISFSCLHIFNSYTITVDSPMAFWVILSFFVSVLNYTNGPKLRYYLLNGIFIGFAVGTKYTAVWCVLPMIYIHLHHVSFSLPKLLDRRLLLGFLLILVAFILTTPFSILDYKTFIYYLQFQQKAYSLWHPGYESTSNSYGYYFQSLVHKYGAIPLMMAGIGVAFSWLNNKRRTILLICFPLFYFLFLGAYKVHFDRNMVCIVPFLALCGGYSVSKTIGSSKKTCLESSLKKYRCLIYVLLVILIILTGVGICEQTYKALTHTHRITLPDTRWISKIWIERNIPAGSLICRESYTPPVDTKKFKVVYVKFIALMKYKPASFRYLIVSSKSYDRFVTNEKKYPKQAQKYKEIFLKYELIKEFIPDDKKIGGPVIRIYKIR